MNNPSKPIVVVKTQNQDRQLSVDLGFLLNSTLSPPGDTIASIFAFAPTTVTDPPLTVTVTGWSATTVTLLVKGGVNTVSYGVGLSIEGASGTAYSETVAVVVQEDLALKYQDQNTVAFQSLVDSIEAGDSAVGKSFFMLPADTDVSGGYVLWSLLDSTGAVYSQGNGYDYRVTKTSSYTSVESHSVVNVPSATPPTVGDQRYQIRWELHTGGGSASQLLYSFETIKVLGTHDLPSGPSDTVEVVGDIATVTSVQDKSWETVVIDIYSGNDLVTQGLKITSAAQQRSGWLYQAEIDTTGILPSLDPYILSWKYSNAVGPSYREQGQMYVINGSIMRDMRSVEGLISKARQTLLGIPDTLFTPPVIMNFLARARDFFNGASGHPTSFDMTNAKGAIREFWLRYAEVVLLQSQYLLEGEKAFAFSGQAISLDSDKSQYYQTLASELKQSVDEQIKPFKANLLKQGITGGDGSASGPQYGCTGLVGISISPASNLGYWGRRG